MFFSSCGFCCDGTEEKKSEYIVNGSEEDKQQNIVYNEAKEFLIASIKMDENDAERLLRAINDNTYANIEKDKDEQQKIYETYIKEYNYNFFLISSKKEKIKNNKLLLRIYNLFTLFYTNNLTIKSYDTDNNNNSKSNINSVLEREQDLNSSNSDSKKDSDSDGESNSNNEDRSQITKTNYNGQSNNYNNNYLAQKEEDINTDINNYQGFNERRSVYSKSLKNYKYLSSSSRNLKKSQHIDGLKRSRKSLNDNNAIDESDDNKKEQNINAQHVDINNNDNIIKRSDKSSSFNYINNSQLFSSTTNRKNRFDNNGDKDDNMRSTIIEEGGNNGTSEYIADEDIQAMLCLPEIREIQNLFRIETDVMAILLRYKDIIKDYINCYNITLINKNDTEKKDKIDVDGRKSVFILQPNGLKTVNKNCIEMEHYLDKSRIDNNIGMKIICRFLKIILLKMIEKNEILKTDRLIIQNFIKKLDENTEITTDYDPVLAFKKLLDNVLYPEYKTIVSPKYGCMKQIEKSESNKPSYIDLLILFSIAHRDPFSYKLLAATIYIYNIGAGNKSKSDQSYEERNLKQFLDDATLFDDDDDFMDKLFGVAEKLMKEHYRLHSSKQIPQDERSEMYHIATIIADTFFKQLKGEDRTKFIMFAAEALYTNNESKIKYFNSLTGDLPGVNDKYKETLKALGIKEQAQNNTRDKEIENLMKTVSSIHENLLLIVYKYRTKIRQYIIDQKYDFSKDRINIIKQENGQVFKLDDIDNLMLIQFLFNSLASLYNKNLIDKEDRSIVKDVISTFNAKKKYCFQQEKKIYNEKYQELVDKIFNTILFSDKKGKYIENNDVKIFKIFSNSDSLKKDIILGVKHLFELKNAKEECLQEDEKELKKLLFSSAINTHNNDVHNNKNNKKVAVSQIDSPNFSFEQLLERLYNNNKKDIFVYNLSLKDRYEWISDYILKNYIQTSSEIEGENNEDIKKMVKKFLIKKLGQEQQENKLSNVIKNRDDLNSSKGDSNNSFCKGYKDKINDIFCKDIVLNLNEEKKESHDRKHNIYKSKEMKKNSFRNNNPFNELSNSANENMKFEDKDSNNNSYNSGTFCKVGDNNVNNIININNNSVNNEKNNQNNQHNFDDENMSFAKDSKFSTLILNKDNEKNDKNIDNDIENNNNYKQQQNSSNGSSREGQNRRDNNEHRNLFLEKNTENNKNNSKNNKKSFDNNYSMYKQQSSLKESLEERQNIRDNDGEKYNSMKYFFKNTQNNSKNSKKSYDSNNININNNNKNEPISSLDNFEMKKNENNEDNLHMDL